MSTKFAKAMTASAKTWNNATSLASPDPTGRVEGRLSLFFKSARGLNIPMLYHYLETSTKETLIDTFVMFFHIRVFR